MKAWRWVLLIWVFGFAGSAGAHPLSPALLELREMDSDVVHVLWRTSKLRIPGSRLEPRLPASCEVDGLPERTEGAESLTTQFRARCSALVGETVGVDGLRGAKTDALVRVLFADGRKIQRVVRAGETHFAIPAQENPLDVVRSFGALGFEHILGGLDHLLFVFGLLLLVQGISALVKTVTAFTLGHSVTLSAAALGFVAYPTGPIEVAIALSVFLMAVELANVRPEQKGWIRRFPWRVAIAFGLLHGLGFAGALREAGLPENEIPKALFSFNVGIEVGQIAFVVAVLALRALWRKSGVSTAPWLEKLPVYAMGSLAAFWCFERIAAL